METIVQTDVPNEFYEILDKVPHLNSVLTYDGVYLAGGALRTLLSQDEEFKPETTDIDLFFSDSNVCELVKSKLESYEWQKVFQCPQGFLATFKRPKLDWKIQCISVDYYSNISEVVKWFDFTVTMFAIDNQNNLVMGENSISHVMDKKLIWNVITYPASSLRRMMKYARKGYHMQEEEYRKFVDFLWAHDANVRDQYLVYID